MYLKINSSVNNLFSKFKPRLVSMLRIWIHSTSLSRPTPISALSLYDAAPLGVFLAVIFVQDSH